VSANPHQGEQPFEACGKQYTLALSWGALAKAERQAEKSTGWLLSNLDWLSTLEVLFFQGLKRHHDKITLDEVHAILGDLTIPGAVKVLEGALLTAFPKKETENRP
jgi:hypothetical protein